MNNKYCFVRILFNIICVVSVFFGFLISFDVSWAQNIFAQNDYSVEYEDFKQKSINNIKEDLFRSIVNSMRAKVILSNNIELKMRSYGGDIFFRKHYSGNVDKNIVKKITSQFHRYEEILGKNFVEKKFKELKVLNVSYFTFLYLNKNDYYKIHELYKSDGIIFNIDDMNSFPCTVEKFSYGGDYIKQTMMIIVDTGDRVAVENCIGNVFFYAFYPGQLLGFLDKKEEKVLMGAQDLFNIRTIYDDRMPFKMEKIEESSDIDVITKENKSWVITCYENNKCK